MFVIDDTIHKLHVSCRSSGLGINANPKEIYHPPYLTSPRESFCPLRVELFLPLLKLIKDKKKKIKKLKNALRLEGQTDDNRKLSYWWMELRLHALETCLNHFRRR